MNRKETHVRAKRYHAHWYVKTLCFSEDLDHPFDGAIAAASDDADVAARVLVEGFHLLHGAFSLLCVFEVCEPHPADLVIQAEMAQMELQQRFGFVSPGAAVDHEEDVVGVDVIVGVERSNVRESLLRERAAAPHFGSQGVEDLQRYAPARFTLFCRATELT